jgi:hypothetical protein
VLAGVCEGFEPREAYVGCCVVCQTGSKEIFHLEAFVAKFMSIYKQFVINLFS